MSDIVERLRTWCHALHAPPASDIMDEAADEIERRRLTDAEREAVEYCAAVIDDPYYKNDAKMAATLRGLLERTK